MGKIFSDLTTILQRVLARNTVRSYKDLEQDSITTYLNKYIGKIF